jgi:hypothetical protein
MAANIVANSDTFKVSTPVTALYPSLEVRDSVLKTGMARGAGISYDRLEDLVSELQRY